MDFERIWNNIINYEGQTFKTIRGIEYSYAMYNGYLLINNDTRRKITKEMFKEAIKISNPSPYKIKAENIWGPSYVYGIITDKRIIQK